MRTLSVAIALIAAGAAGASAQDYPDVTKMSCGQAQSIVDGAQLTGAAFDALIVQFPQLSGVVHAFAGSMTDAAAVVCRNSLRVIMLLLRGGQ